MKGAKPEMHNQCVKLIFRHPKKQMLGIRLTQVTAIYSISVAPAALA